MSNEKTFWALCLSDGAVRIDDDGRALVFGSRKAAREFNDNSWEPLHVEKVEIL
jgi:hypothetical protein